MEIFFISVTYLILRFAIVQNKFQQTNKTMINHINDNHIKFEVFLHFGGSGLLCAAAAATVARIWPEFRVLKGVDCWYCGLGCCWAQPIRWLQWVSTFHIRVHDETVTSQLHYPGNLHMLGFGRAGGRIINYATLSRSSEEGGANLLDMYCHQIFLLVISTTARFFWSDLARQKNYTIKMFWYHEKLIYYQNVKTI